jgi:hypothetical protein
MYRRLPFMLAVPLLLAACRGPALETRTFDLSYLDGGTAEQMVRPYVYTDRAGAPGQLSITRQTITVRETRDNLERIARVLAEQDRPPANVRLDFQIIRADGPAPLDPAIAPIEAQLRRLFRFQGYRLVGQTFAVATAGTQLHQQVAGPGGPYGINGEIETVGVRGDSGVVRLMVSLDVARSGRALLTRLSVPIGQTAVIGGQSSDGPGALILAVRSELVAP